MLSATEMEYASGLVENMRGQGYLYYVVRTVSESGNRFDFECIFSKEEITANGLNSFSVPSGAVRYQVDSSGWTIGGSSQNSGDRVIVSNFSGTYSFAETEFGYSNAVFEGGTVLPDLRRREGGTYESTQTLVMVGALLVCVFVFALLFRRR